MKFYGYRPLTAEPVRVSFARRIQLLVPGSQVTIRQGPLDARDSEQEQNSNEYEKETAKAKQLGQVHNENVERLG